MMLNVWSFFYDFGNFSNSFAFNTSSSERLGSCVPFNHKTIESELKYHLKVLLFYFQT